MAATLCHRVSLEHVSGCVMKGRDRLGTPMEVEDVEEDERP